MRSPAPYRPSRPSGDYPRSAVIPDPPSHEFLSLPSLPCSLLEKAHTCVYVVALGKITEKVAFSAVHSNPLRRPCAAPAESLPVFVCLCSRGRICRPPLCGATALGYTLSVANYLSP